MTTETYITTRGKSVITKDPDANLDYAFDWSKWLADIGDTIANAEFLVDDSLTVTQQGFNATTATVWLSDGIAPVPPAANELRVTCRITTAGGRIDDRSIFLKIVPR